MYDRVVNYPRFFIHPFWYFSCINSTDISRESEAIIKAGSPLESIIDPLPVTSPNIRFDPRSELHYLATNKLSRRIESSRVIYPDMICKQYSASRSQFSQQDLPIDFYEAALLDYAKICPFKPLLGAYGLNNCKEGDVVIHVDFDKMEIYSQIVGITQDMGVEKVQIAVI